MKNTNNEIIRELQEYLDGVREIENSSFANLNEWLEHRLEEGRIANQKGTSGRDKGMKTHRVAKPRPGRMYTFGYSAKTAKKLPYWDKYPLILCLAVQGNRMVGVNLHYIPPKNRQEFLDVVMRFSSTKELSNNSYLKITPAKVRNLKWVPHMMKNYLFSHVVETFQEIAPKDWGKAIHLKTQQFTAYDKGKNISATVAYNDRNK